MLFLVSSIKPPFIVDFPQVFLPFSRASRWNAPTSSSATWIASASARRQRRQRPWGQGVGIYWNCIIWGGSINGRSISWKIQLKWMICGYLYFRKPPYNSWICIYIYIIHIYIYYTLILCMRMPVPKKQMVSPVRPPFHMKHTPESMVKIVMKKVLYRG